jgi:PAS domain S-box-containing protein
MKVESLTDWAVQAPSVPDQTSLIRRVDELEALYQLTDELYRAQSPADVYEAALNAINSALQCSRASILLFDTAGVMRFVAWRGLSSDYRRAVDGHSPWKPGDRDPQPIFVENIDDADEPEDLKTKVNREGISALGFIPIVARGLVIGKFMTYHDQPHAFSDHEVELAVTIARQLGFSLERMRAEEAREAAEEALRESEERFRLMTEQAPVMIWMSDAEGQCLQINRMLRSFWAIDEAALSEFNWLTMIHPEDAPEICDRMSKALTARTSVSLQGRYRNAQGEYRILQTDARPRFSADGVFMGMIGVNVDITERVYAEKALRHSEEQFRLAVEAAPSGMVLTDAEGRIVLVNAHAEALFGYSRGELVGQPIELLVPERFRPDHPKFREVYSKQPEARPMGGGRDLFALRKDGVEVPVEIGLSPIQAELGTMVLAAIVDISQRKRGEAQRELLIAELNHRVKNTLGVVQAIAHQSFKGMDSAAPARTSFEGRLVALGATHTLLSQSNWDVASLQELTKNALEASTVDSRRISVEGPEVQLQPKQALAIAMAVHELCTNALKYGALSNEEGRITVQWSKSSRPQSQLQFVWRETGGPPVVPPKRRGFGSQLIEQALTHELDAEVTLDFRAEGLVCTITAAFSE